MHPRRREAQILGELVPFLRRQRSREMRDPLGRDVVLAKVSECLNHQAAESPCGRHIAQRRATKLDGHWSHSYEAAWAISQEHDFHGHLLGQSQQVGRVGSRRLEPSPISSGNGFGNDLGGWLQFPESGVVLWVKVDAPCQTPEGIAFRQP